MPEFTIEAKNHLHEGGEILKQVAEIMQDRTVTVTDLLAVDRALSLLREGLRAHIVTALITPDEE